MSPDTLSLAGKVAIITGSGKENGIGAGIASALARNGAAVVINYVSDTSASRAAGVAKKIENAGGRAVVVRADVSTQEGAKNLVETSLKALQVDKVDILVNNAGGGPLIDVMQATGEDVEKTFALNVFASLFMTQAVVPVMPRGGRIINIGSIASKMGMAPVALYSAAKAAVDTLSYALAMELGRGHGITINTIAPGPVQTDGLPPGAVGDAIPKFLVPLTRAEERIGTAEDIGDAVLLLTSEKSRWITGQYISASGGITGG
ncbi:uncharacterized protein Z520_00193 [Fonsecaea multimorphosa CBS 102226]|uniref:Uncharacterized protein n=1 Tax=Fonsecaea multimorphosa CBS 102226 TaxID=1442371 RepID=A0A0D2J292_9EURO|nr:uncharacterized protein Z520_00193 [Fonsecaea multimorphosa CBS 102226]KIY03502.1 hypothetical protein Z520_00193 [Fonsecaea multimorphosa CBS 102226]